MRQSYPLVLETIRARARSLALTWTPRAFQKLVSSPFDDEDIQRVIATARIAGVLHENPGTSYVLEGTATEDRLVGLGCRLLRNRVQIEDVLWDYDRAP
ncbi:MAG: hypothetical protein JO332_01955 [Planctomycetaceae bacterium]|nr:hypothetical protein [Planctomycetaceae bacterium]